MKLPLNQYFARVNLFKNRLFHNFTEKLWVCASLFKGIKKRSRDGEVSSPYLIDQEKRIFAKVKPPYSRGTDN
ncbi:hypothetical protein D5R40_24105 [Okeania hirsuta]|uniref:Uncharacterized protein n=1 Tax=Okeania hirsuta TaxID=1458930 RepID=A0A3N6R980_9CYAN|nr:hypothetical protein D5R40_24105 [Okeania hirsuta]